MTDDQPDYTQDVAITVIDTPDPITVIADVTSPPLNVTFPSTQNVAVTSMPASTTVAVASVPGNMTTVPSQPYIPGRTAAFEDSSFVTGDSPATHDVNAALGRNAHDGYIHNAGSGDMQYQISDNGTNYGGTHTLKAGAKAKLTGLDIDSIKVTWVADTEYYIAVV